MMKVLVCENNSSGASYLFMVTECLGKLFTGIDIAESVSKKITEEEQSPLISRQVVWRNYSEQKTGIQNSVKTRTNSTKKETPLVYGNRCSFHQKIKIVQLNRDESVEII